MSVRDTTLHPQSDGSIDLYPKTRAGQVIDKLSYMHNLSITIWGVDNVTNEDVYCLVQCNIISNKSTVVNTFALFKEVFLNCIDKKLNSYGFCSREDGDDILYFYIRRVKIYDDNSMDIEYFEPNDGSADYETIELSDVSSSIQFEDEVINLYA